MIGRASSMEAYPNSSSKRKDGSELSLREWGMKAQSNNYYGEKTKSRRHSASYIRSFNEETKSFRSSNITFSSATSSPAYPFNKDHGIDPSTYSFNSAIKALQARSCYNSWECLSPDGFALNSKWNEAEKYICNPLSGEVPIECLSSKALISGRSFRKSIPNKVIAIISEDHNDDDDTLRNAQTKTSSSSTYYTQEEDDHEALHHYFPTIPEKKKEGKTRDVGIQSTSPYVSSKSSSPSPASTPSIIERSIQLVGDSPNSNAKTKSEEEEAEEKDKEIEIETETEAEKMDDDEFDKKDKEQICREGGCFPWIKKIKLKEKGRRRKINIFLTHC